MALPDVKLTIEDGALGTLPTSVSGAVAKVGVCSAGLIGGGITGYANAKTMQTALGVGPLVESAAQVLAVGGGPIYAVPVTPSVAGTVSSVTKTGPGTGTVAVVAAPDRVVKFKISTGGAINTMAFQYSIGTAEYSTAVVSSGGSPFLFRVPGMPLVVISFSAGTYVLNDVYTVNVDGSVVLVGTGPAAVTISSASPLDVYDAKVTIVTAGALGVGAFTYSVDGSNSTSATIAIPGSGKYAIPGTGLVLTFAGTFTKDDTYAFTTVAAGFSTSDVTAALTLLSADPVQWDHVHIVGLPASAAAAATLAATVDASMTANETAFRYAYGVVECPQAEGDAAIKAAFASFQSARISVCVGDTAMVSQLTGRKNRRNCAWAVSARVSAIKPVRSPAAVRDGTLKNITSLYRDEAATPGLDEARFTTLRTHSGESGYYVTSFRMMAAGGSDYTFGMRRRVMDKACRITRQGMLKYLDVELEVDEAGLLDERETQAIEADVGGQLRSGIIAEKQASGSSIVIDRGSNVLSTGLIPVTVRIRPKGYARNIEVSIGFVNPALQAAA